MITGYKRKKLGQPSTDKATGGDSPRAPWRAVIFSEVLFPIVMAVIFVIAYMFVKSFPVTPGRTNAPPLIRIAVVSLGPIVWNAAVLLVQFLISVLLGPMMDSCCVKFGSVVAFVVHVLALEGMVGFFEFLVSTCSCLHAQMLLIGVCFQWFLEV
jgi:1,3-beta-glucan synthase